MSATALAEPLTEEPVAPPPGVHFGGPERAFWRLLTRGAVLLLVTLGLYRFWLATDVRRFLWSNTEIAGDSLEYIGTAREILIGFLIAIAFLLPVNAVFYLGALARGMLGQLIGALGLAALVLLGQFAVYRARRYRLSRTVYRGIRFHQTGSAWRYAVCAIFWWTMIALTLGLAYPFAQASLERFKIRNTFYGDLQGQFVGSGLRLFFRGFLLWLLVVGPFVLGLMAAVGTVDWTLVAEALRRGGDIMARFESAGAAQAAAFALISISWSVLAAATLYPAFQAMMLRWWISGLRFGRLSVHSHLRTGTVYALYWRFVWLSLGAALALGVMVGIGIGLIALIGMGRDDGTKELLQGAGAIAGYVLAALAYSTIYQATVKLRLWKHGFESVELAGTEVLDTVKAAATSGSPVGEGLADALHVGGI